MSGKITDTISITDEEARGVELLKKMKQRNRKKKIGLAAGIIVIVCVSVFLVLSQIRCTATYDEVTLNYGVRGNRVWFTMETDPGYEMHITGSIGGKNSTVRVLGVSEGNGKADKMGWESELGTENDPCRCTIIFADRTLVFENGKLVKDTEN